MAVMTAEVKPSGGRAAKAAATRSRMIRAANELFRERGYAETTMNDIATRAGVAVQTLYFSFSTKPGLLHAAFVDAVMGETPVPPGAQPWWRQMQRARTGETALAHAVDGALAIFERVAPLVAAVRTTSREGAAAQVWARQNEMRRHGFAAVLEIIIAKQPLRVGLTPDKALETMLVVLSPDTFTACTQDLHMSTSEYRRWVLGLLSGEMFGRQ
jgi:TetR/AcrR family transcriptional regulator of autoinduction and epiphytic fitness